MNDASQMMWDEQISLDDLVNENQVSLGRGNIISKIDIRNNPGPYPIYSSSAKKSGKMGEYGNYMFDEEMISWSIDGGGYFFYRPKHKFSVTNVSGYLRIMNTGWTYRFLHYSLDYQHKFISFDYQSKAHPSVIRDLYYIPVIPVAEQQKIASILTSVDDVIEKTESQINKLQDLKKGMMQELLTKGIGHTEFKEIPKWKVGKFPELKLMPLGWELVDILSVAKLESGHTPSRKIPEYWGGDVQWLSLHDTKQLHNRVVNQTALTITEDGLANSSARLLPKGTVAFSRTASVGNCVVLGCEMATSQDFANYICGDRLNNRYLMHMFKWMQHVWISLCGGSTHQTIYMPDFKQLQILLPPIEEQYRMANIIDAIDDKISATMHYLHPINAIKKALMQDLLTGKVRVTIN